MNGQANQYQQIIAKCWADDAFKERLVSDPAGTLETEGMAVQAGVTLRVVEDTAHAVTAAIPPRPADLSDQATRGRLEFGGNQRIACHHFKGLIVGSA
jgi:hypothetical protein